MNKMNKSLREVAIQWWISLLNTDKLMDDYFIEREPSSLTGREIEGMYLKEKMQGRVFQTVNVTSYDDDTEVDFIYNNPHCKQPESCSKSLSHKCICPSDIDDKLEAAVERHINKMEIAKHDTMNDINSVLTIDEIGFIVSALNFYWNDANQNLERDDIGDWERIMYQQQKQKSKELMTKLNN